MHGFVEIYHNNPSYSAHELVDSERLNRGVQKWDETP